MAADRDGPIPLQLPVTARRLNSQAPCRPGKGARQDCFQSCSFSVLMTSRMKMPRLINMDKITVLVRISIACTSVY